MLAYGYSSRHAEGLAVAPEPQSFEEAKAQLSGSELLIRNKRCENKEKLAKAEEAARKQEKARAKDVR